MGISSCGGAKIVSQPETPTECGEHPCFALFAPKRNPAMRRKLGDAKAFAVLIEIMKR
jgi:hypothetical protein